MPAGSPRTPSARVSKPDRFRSASDVMRAGGAGRPAPLPLSHRSRTHLLCARSGVHFGRTAAPAQAVAGVRGGRPETTSRVLVWIPGQAADDSQGNGRPGADIAT